MVAIIGGRGSSSSSSISISSSINSAGSRNSIRANKYSHKSRAAVEERCGSDALFHNQVKRDALSTQCIVSSGKVQSINGVRWSRKVLSHSQTQIVSEVDSISTVDMTTMGGDLDATYHHRKMRNRGEGQSGENKEEEEDLERNKKIRIEENK